MTTAALSIDSDLQPYAAPSNPQPSIMATNHLSWHKGATHTNDIGSFLPLDHLRELANDGFIGSVGPRFIGIPTVYSQRRTMSWSEHVRQWLEEDEVDLTLLVPL